MIPLKQALTSSVGTKLITALTGLALIIFTITHLAGNLTLFAPGAHAFNAYSQALEDKLGPLLPLVKAGLIGVILIHVLNGIMLKRNHIAARPVGYRNLKTKGGPSKSNLSSRNMIWSGIVLFVFLVVHLTSFKWGPGVAEGYTYNLDGHTVRDLHRLVVERFSSPFYVAFYVGCMLFFGSHIKHGIWSSLQSMGILTRRTSGTTYVASFLLGLLLAVGFLILPIYVYFISQRGAV